MNSIGYNHSPEDVVLRHGLEASKKMVDHHIPVEFVGETATGVTVTVDGHPVPLPRADLMLYEDLDKVSPGSEIPEEIRHLDFPVQDDPVPNKGHGKLPRDQRPNSKADNSKPRDNK